jgi:hypothetical protein
MSLFRSLTERNISLEALSESLNQLAPSMLERFNSEVAPRLISRLPSEPLPTSPAQASSFRSRVSLLVEYSLIEILDSFLAVDEPKLLTSFNLTNQFSDFFIRSVRGEIELRIDVKTVHDESLEASARFDMLEADIQITNDFLLYVPWQWRDVDFQGRTVTIPALIGAIFIPAIDVATERDKRQILAGGSFGERGIALASSGNPDSNFGKINRLVHASRRRANDLNPLIRQLLDLVERQSAIPVASSMDEAEALANQASSVGETVTAVTEVS